MNIYEISQQFNYLQSLLMENPDDECIIDTIESVDYDFDMKCENYVKVIKNLEATQKALSEEIKNLQDKKKRAEKGIEKLKQILENSLYATGKTKAGGELFTISLRKNPPKLPEIGIDDVPIEYLIPQEPKIDKKQLLADVKSGKVKGIDLVTGQSLMIK